MSKKNKPEPKSQLEIKELTYAEKVGLPNYSSAYISVTAVLNGEDFDASFEAIKAKVAEKVSFRVSESGVGSGQSRWGNPDAFPTEKQLELIRNLCTELDESMEHIEEIATRREASSIIDSLLQRRADHLVHEVPA